MKKIHIKNYPNSAEYKIQIYPLFMEMGIKLLNPFGVNNFIVPDSFLIGKYFSKIRNFYFQSDKLFFSFLNTMYLKQLWVSQLFIFHQKILINLMKALATQKLLINKTNLTKILMFITNKILMNFNQINTKLSGYIKMILKRNYKKIEKDCKYV